MPSSRASFTIAPPTTSFSCVPMRATNDSIELQRVDRVALQVAERRIAGAEVVEVHGDADLAQPLEVLIDDVGVVDQHALGDLELQTVAAAGRCSISTASTSSTKFARANSFDEMFTDSCSGRPNICCHAATWWHASTEHVVGQRDDEPGLLRDRR